MDRSSGAGARQRRPHRDDARGRTDGPQTSVVTLLSLPDEIALHVLSFLGPCEVCTVGSVSRHWHKLALDSTLWRALYMREQELRALRSVHLYHCAPSSATGPLRLSAERAARDWRGLFKEDRMTRRSWLAGNVSPEATLAAPSSVYAVKFDDERVVCGLQDSHIRVYDRKTAQITLTLSGHRDWVGAVQYDDTKARHTLVSCSGDMHIRVWNWEGTCTQKLKGHTGWVKRLQYNDEILVSCSGDRSVRLWRWTDTSHPYATLVGHSDGVMGLQFANGTIVSGSLDGTMCVWDAETESCLRTLHNIDKESKPSEVRSLVFDRDTIVSGGSDSLVKIWDRSTGQPRRELKGHQGYVKYVYMDDYKIVSGGGDGTIRVWDCRGTSDSSLYTIAAHTRDIINMDVHENAFASGSLDDSLKMWVVDR